MHILFKHFDIHDKNEVDLQSYKDAIANNKELLEIFDFLCRGISQTVNPKEKENELKIAQSLINMEMQLQNLTLIINDDQKFKIELIGLNNFDNIYSVIMNEEQNKQNINTFNNNFAQAIKRHSQNPFVNINSIYI